MALVIIGLITVLCGPSESRATPYWIAWEGEDFPEAGGFWQRNYGFGGCVRTLSNGVMTLDGMRDRNIWDFVYTENAIKVDLNGPSEEFRMQWRLKVDKVEGVIDNDPSVSIASDARRQVSFEFGESYVSSAFEPGNNATFQPGVFHDYEFRSTDMRTYALRIDGQVALTGTFWDSATRSYIGWGEGRQGASSLTDWDYFRCGVVVPEPTSCVSLAVLLACARKRASHD
jgi:hypothetical protein